MPLLLALYWLSVLEVVSAHCVLSVVGKFEVNITSPAPCFVKAASTHQEVDCDCLYQALLNENVNFTLAVNTTMGITIDVQREGCFLDDCTSTRCGDGYDQESWAANHCDSSEVCTYSCTTDEQLTRGVNMQKFSVVASPYSQQHLSDTKRSVCVQVNETRSLKFQSDPGPYLSTRNGSATFVYVVDGYPLPIAYELVCSGQIQQRSEQGVFQLSNLSYGSHECFVTARSRIESISSNVTQLTVVKAPETFPAVPPEPAAQDLHYYTIGGVCSVAAVIVLLVVAAVIARKVVKRRQSKVPPSVVNIHNDNSQYTTYIHNGPKVESFGPNSTIIVNPVTAQLLNSGDDCDHSNHGDWIMHYGAQACADDPETVTYTFVDANDSLSRDSLER